jgi:serine/threonine protein kinase
MPVDDITQAAAEICAARSLNLVSEVGQGAFKRTFQVADADSVLHALKLYRQGAANERTSREVAAMVKCSHRAIGRLETIDSWRNPSGEYAYLIEEFLSGGTLSTRIAKGLFDRSQLRHFGNELIDALTHTEALSLVHRDIKPDNIMFRTVDGQPVLVDFGLVRDLGQTSLTQTWQPQGPGTPFFAAPEQLNNAKALIDWRTDQFALGVVLSICATGRHPFDTHGTNSVDVVRRVASYDALPDPFIFWANANRLEVLTRMVQPWPIQRYRTPALLKAAWSKELSR